MLGNPSALLQPRPGPGEGWRVLALVVVAWPLSTVAAFAGPLTAADRAWVETCVAQRASSDLKGAAAGRYCRCMQEIVEDNRPFDSMSELEGTYPPAHRSCIKRAARR